MNGHAILHALNPWWQSPSPWRGPVHLHRRDIHDELQRRVTDPGLRRATVLLGPRQVGKSTVLRQLVATLLERGWPASSITYFDFKDDRVQTSGEPPDLEFVARYRPTSACAEVSRVLLLDEIHLAPAWSLWLKRVVDEQRAGLASKTSIVVTSSAASLLDRGGVESGQGRWDDLLLLGLTFPEYLRFLSRSGERAEDVLARSPGELERYLAKGGLPEHVLEEPSDDLRRQLREDIADRAIKRDLLDPDPSRSGPDRIDIDRIRRLFVYLVRDSGAILNVTERARDLGAHRASTTNWIELLRDACLLQAVEPFHPTRGGASPKAARSLGSKPRLLALEHGLIPAFSTALSPLSDPHVRGQVFDSVVLRHLIAAAKSRDEIEYFRRKDGLEIDFVLPVDGELVAVEVTSSPSPDARKFERLVAAREAVGAARALLVHGGVVGARKGPLESIPLGAFLLDAARALRGGGV